MENQVGQKEGPAEYFLLVDFSKLGDVLTFILILCHSGQFFIFIGKGLVYSTLERTLLLNTITYYVDTRICYIDDFSCITLVICTLLFYKQTSKQVIQ